MNNNIEFYKNYHNNPINKAIHFVCIPMIVTSIMIFLKYIYILYSTLNTKVTFGLTNIIMFLYFVGYYKSFNLKISLIMMLYFYILRSFADYIVIHYTNSTNISWFMFIFGWIMQFVGHYIEGRKPALFDSITQAFFEAPLYTLEYAYPNLLK
jgi:uncharacterized membrane protein YGL010W